MKLKKLVEEYGEYNISREILEMLKAEKTNWKPKDGEKYYFVNVLGLVESDLYVSQSASHLFRLSKRNAYQTIEEAQFAIDMYNFCKKRSFEPDWTDNREIKYAIFLDYENNAIQYGTSKYINDFQPFFYPTEGAVKEVIKKYTFEELKNYYGRV